MKRQRFILCCKFLYSAAQQVFKHLKTFKNTGNRCVFLKTYCYLRFLSALIYMANNKDGTEPSRYIKRRVDLEDADLIFNQMLMKKQKSFFVPTIATQHETSPVQLNLSKQPMVMISIIV